MSGIKAISDIASEAIILNNLIAHIRSEGKITIMDDYYRTKLLEQLQRLNDAISAVGKLSSCAQEDKARPKSKHVLDIEDDQV